MSFSNKTIHLGKGELQIVSIKFNNKKFNDVVSEPDEDFEDQDELSEFD